MKLSKERITTALEQKGWSQNELVRNIGFSHGTLSNALNGRRGVGRSILSGLLQIFPDQSVASLTIPEKQVGA